MTSNNNPAGKGKRRFRVALSFAGERREHVRGVAQYLAKQLGGEQYVLYDEYHKDDFSRLKLDEYLPPLYKEESDLIAAFLCDDYDKKLWTGLEWQEIEKLRDRDDSWRVMPHKFAGSKSEKLVPTDGYIYIDKIRTSIDTADGILNRLRINDEQEAGSNGDSSPGSPVENQQYDPEEERKAFFILAHEKIRKALCREHLSSLKEKLLIDDGFKKSLNELCSVDCCQRKELFENLFEMLFEATEECWLNEFNSDHPEQDNFEKGAKEIFGWLVLLSVHDEMGGMAQALRSAEDFQLEIELPLNMLASVEIVASRLNERCPSFTLVDNYEVIGENHVLPSLELEVGPSDEAMVLAVKQAIWTLAMGSRHSKYNPKRDDKILDGELKVRKRLKRPYYLPVLKDDGDNPLNNTKVYRQVLNDLKNLGAVFLCGGERDVFITDEVELVALMRQYLRLFGEKHES